MKEWYTSFMDQKNEFIKVAYTISFGLQLGFLIAIPVGIFLKLSP